MSKILNVYIHDDNQESLSGIENQSRLINELLREHFRRQDPNQMTPEEIRKAIAIQKIEREYKTKLEKLKNGVS